MIKFYLWTSQADYGYIIADLFKFGSMTYVFSDLNRRSVMNDRHNEGPEFNDANWGKLRAPVFPFSWVIEKIKETGLPVEWENTGMRYRSEYDGDEIVTRLLPGSPTPVRGWLR